MGPALHHLLGRSKDGRVQRPSAAAANARALLPQLRLSRRGRCSGGRLRIEMNRSISKTDLQSLAMFG